MSDTSHNTFKAVVIGALGIIVGAGFAGLVLRSPQIQPAAAPVAAPAAAPSVVVQPLVTIPQAVVSQQAQEPVAEPSLGGLIHNIQESFDAGLAVNGSEIVDSSGRAKFTNFDASSIATTQIMGAVSSTMTAATTTLCAVQNTSGFPRALLFEGLTYGSSTVAANATISFSVVTSSNAYATTTATPPLAAGTIGLFNSKANGAVSSTIGMWLNNEWLLFKSNTTTNVGTCRATFL